MFELKRALVLLVRAIFDQMDEVASLQRQGKAAEVSRRVLREMCGVLRDLPEDAQQVYFEILQTLTAASTPRAAPTVGEEFVELSVSPRLKFVSEVRDVLTRRAG